MYVHCGSGAVAGKMLLVTNACWILDYWDVSRSSSTRNILERPTVTLLSILSSDQNELKEIVLIYKVKFAFVNY